MLREKLIERFAGALEETELEVPWAQQRMIHHIHERTTVLAEEHHEGGTKLRVRAPSRTLEELRAAIAAG